MVEFIRSIQIFDLLVILALLAMFIIGYIQGAIRRLLGIASILFSFLLAANLRDPVGSFFADNWTHLPREYGYFIAFGGTFLVAAVAFSLAIQTLYTKVELVEKYPIVDEVGGGLLGLFQGLLILGIAVFILDSYFAIPGIAPDAEELPLLRQLHEALGTSATGNLYRTTILPAFVAIVAPLLPEDLANLY